MEVGKLGFRLAFPVGVDFWIAVIDAGHSFPNLALCSSHDSNQGSIQ